MGGAGLGLLYPTATQPKHRCFPALTERLPVPYLPLLKATERNLKIAAGATMGVALMAGLASGRQHQRRSGLAPSPLGHYLASRHAQATHDLPAAADFLGFALDADPDNAQLLETSFNLLMVPAGADDALKVAKRMESVGSLGTLARVSLAIDRAKAKRPSCRRCLSCRHQGRWAGAFPGTHAALPGPC